MTTESNKNENGNFITKTLADTLFNFEDDSGDDFELVLPPECEIRQSSIAGCSRDEQTIGLLYEESSEEKRVSFDMSRNEYLTVERYIYNSENSQLDVDYDGDDEQQPGYQLKKEDSENSQFETNYQPEKKGLLQIDNRSQSDHLELDLRSLKISTEVSNNTEDLDNLSEKEDVSSLSQNIPVTNSDQMMDTANYKDMIACCAEETPSQNCDSKAAIDIEKAASYNEKMSVNAKLDLFTEYISKIDIPEDRLVKILLSKENDILANKGDGPSKLDSAVVNSCQVIQFQDIPEPPPIVEASKVIVENIRSLKDNPFILKDKSGKI